MKEFNSYEKAEQYVAKIVDIKIPTTVDRLEEGICFRSRTVELEGDRFTNHYDVEFDQANFTPKISTFSDPISPYGLLRQQHCRSRVATSGGFFYLADKSSGRPRQLALNLSAADGNMHSLPVVDREALFVHNHQLESQKLAALGSLVMKQKELSWSGSLTDYGTDCKVYGNGNIVITHDEDPVTSKARVLAEASKFTPKIEDDDHVDLGLINVGEGLFEPKGTSRNGEMNTFDYDIVLRTHERHAKGADVVEIKTIGELAVEHFFAGAFSSGPMLDTEDFELHAVNFDRSLGDRPPFIERPMARTVVYKTIDGKLHISLFDGRPNSSTFKGVTPSEASQILSKEHDILWGCFTDPGQTAKICINTEGVIRSYGNRHYMKWPSKDEPMFRWTPNQGRGIASILSF